MLPTIIYTVLVAAAAALAFITVVFYLAYRRRRYDALDVAWGLMFIVITLTAYFVGHTTGQRSLLLVVLVTVWGLRLSTHIAERFRSKNEEDRRYAELRPKFRRHPVAAPYFKLFVPQALLALVITLPVTIALTTSSSALGWLDWVGVAVWLVGFGFEKFGDSQLSAFLANKDNKGKLMTGGLWRYTRHPNYFGEITQWWAIWLIALSAPWGWVGVIGPVVITYLILFVSGIPLLEKRYAGRPDWEAYKATTNKLVPWFPRRQA